MSQKSNTKWCYTSSFEIKHCFGFLQQPKTAQLVRLSYTTQRWTQTILYQKRNDLFNQKKRSANAQFNLSNF